jgi:hypothetical protein
MVHLARYESYPNATQEVLAVGLSIPAMDSTGARRALLGGGRRGEPMRSGKIDALAAGLAPPMHDGKRRAALARSARDTVALFKMEKVAENWIALFEKLSERRRFAACPGIAPAW